MAPLKRILCPTDLGDGTRTIVRSACELCRALSAELVLIHVVNPTQFAMATHEGAGAGAMACVPAMDGAVAAATIALRKLAAETLSLGVPCNVHVLLGSPAETILRAAAALHADLIVIGLRRRSWLRRLILASPTELVVRESPCPVLVVPAAASPRQKPM